MGIRFACHVCQRRLNIKRELAGRRGICPVCAARIRIPLDDCETSTPVDEEPLAGGRLPSQIGSDDHPPVDDPLDWHSDDAPLAIDPVSPAVQPEPTAQPEPTEPASGATSEAMDVLAEQPEATWYVRPPSGGQYGPATTELLRQWIGEGRVAATALLWREGWPQWRDASEALPQYADRLPAGGAAGHPAAPVIGGTDLPDATESQTPLTTQAATTNLSPRSKWTRAVMTIGLLSVLALSLILVLAFAVLR
jgi:hypothetical protein